MMTDFDISFFQAGKAIEIRGFGSDQRKITCQGYSMFQDRIDLNMYEDMVHLMSKFSDIF